MSKIWKTVGIVEGANTTFALQQEHVEEVSHITGVRTVNLIPIDNHRLKSVTELVDEE